MYTAQQDNAGCIPKALWDQLPPHAKSTLSNSKCHTKQQANSIMAHLNDHTDKSVADTLPTYASNSVHHMSTETASPSESTTVLNSLLSSSCSTTSNSHSINVTSGDDLVHSIGSSYTVNMASCHLPVFTSHLQSLIDGGAHVGLTSTDVHILEYTE